MTRDEANQYGPFKIKLKLLSSQIAAKGVGWDGGGGRRGGGGRGVCERTSGVGSNKLLRNNQKKVMVWR